MRRFFLLLISVSLILFFVWNKETQLSRNEEIVLVLDIPLVVPTSTFTPTTVPPPTDTPTNVPTIVPPTPIPTLHPDEIYCNVPMSFMLHWNDMWALPGILDQIQVNGYVAITYEQWFWFCERGYDTSKAVILSFDDAGPTGIYSDLRWMISYTAQRGFVGVVGVIMGELSDEEWSFLRDLHSRGWEIANHSKSHPSEGLPFLSQGALEEEISYVQSKVSEKIGASPSTLILPGGTYNGDKRIDKFAGKYNVKFIVGIATGGLDPWIQGPGPYYVGRVGIDPNNPWLYAVRVFGPKNPQ